MGDPRTPRVAKWMIGLAAAYLVTPFDIIPDFIPILGQLDDLLIIPLLIWIAIKLTPARVITDARTAMAAANKTIGPSTPPT